jgi:hypothetical protein
LVTIGWLWQHFCHCPFPLFNHHQMATTFSIAIRWLMVVLITNFWTGNQVHMWLSNDDRKLLHPFDGDQIGIVSLKLHEVKKRIMVSFLCYLFYALDFVSLVTHLQPLHRTSNDLRGLKSWICGGITNHVEVNGTKSFQRQEHFINPFLKTIEVLKWWS